MTTTVKKTCLFLLTVFLTSQVHAAGKIYSWKDKDGNIVYGDEPPTDLSIPIEEKKVRRNAPGGGAPGQPNVEVRFYTVKDCDSCDLVKLQLEKRKIPFKTRDVSEDRKIQDELKEKSGKISVPTLVVGEKVIVGFRRSEINNALDEAGFAKPDAGKPSEDNKDK